MRSSFAAAALAVSVALVPVAALAQDFSITNPGESLHFEGAGIPPDWIKQLQAWWDLHAYYPPEALKKNVSGTVKVHIVIQPDGQVFRVEIVQGSGSKILDDAAFYIFHNGFLRPFPAGTPAPRADATITMHFVLEHGATAAAAKRPFTVTDAPVKDNVFEVMQLRTCSGIENLSGTGNPSTWYGRNVRVTLVFHRNPDGTQWVDYQSEGGRLFVAPVVQLGISAQWSAMFRLGGQAARWTHYSVYPAPGDHLAGPSDDGGQLGYIDVTCDTKILPAMKANPLLESPN